MFKVTVNNEEDYKFIPIMEFALTDIYKKILGARVMYGDKLIDYLNETNQTEMLMDAMNGKLDEGSIRMDKDTYERIYG